MPKPYSGLHQARLEAETAPEKEGGEIRFPGIAHIVGFDVRLPAPGDPVPGQIGPQIGTRSERAEHRAGTHREERTRAWIPLAKRPEIVREGTRQHDQIRLCEAGAHSGSRLGEPPFPTGGA